MTEFNKTVLGTIQLETILRIYKLTILILLLLSPLASAENATETAQNYFKTLQNKDFVATVSYFDPEQLKEFRSMMDFITGLPQKTQTQFYSNFFSSNITSESISKLSDSEFFTSIFSSVMRMAEIAGEPNFRSFEILGQVPEGENITHLVTRTKVSVGANEVETIDVLSMKKVEKQWKVLLSGKIKGLPAQLKTAFERQKSG